MCRQTKGGRELNPEDNVLVFVTAQPSCYRLIQAGAAIAETYHMPLKVVTIQPPGPLSKHAADNLQVLYNISGKLGAEMTILFNENPALTAAVHAHQTGAKHIVSGSPGGQSQLFIEAVRQLVPEIPWTVVDDQQQAVTFPPLAVVGT